MSSTHFSHTCTTPLSGVFTVAALGRCEGRARNGELAAPLPPPLQAARRGARRRGRATPCATSAAQRSEARHPGSRLGHLPPSLPRAGGAGGAASPRGERTGEHRLPRTQRQARKVELLKVTVAPAGRRWQAGLSFVRLRVPKLPRAASVSGARLWERGEAAAAVFFVCGSGAAPQCLKNQHRRALLPACADQGFGSRAWRTLWTAA